MFWICFNGNSTIVCNYLDYQVFKALDDLNANFMREIFYRSLNLTQRKEQSISSFLKRNKQNLQVTWGTHIELVARKHVLCIFSLNSNCNVMFEFYYNGFRGVIILQ